MDFFFLLKGYYIVIFKGSDIQRCLNISKYRDVDLWDIHIDKSKESDGICSCKVGKHKYEFFLDILYKTDMVLIESEIYGIPRWIKCMKEHIWFLTGAGTALFLLVLLSNCIWNIEIKGNSLYHDETILRFLKKESITSGILKKDISCIALSDLIRNEFEHLTWVSAELEGCKLVLNLKENLHTDEVEQTDNNSITAYDIVADKDGIISSVFVREGTAEVETGKSVKKGDILIRGMIPIKNDAGNIISYEHKRADGDVFISSEQYYYESIPRIYKELIIVEEKTQYIPILYHKYPVKRDMETDNQIIIKRVGSLMNIENLKEPFCYIEEKRIQYGISRKCYNDEQLISIANTNLHDFYTNLEKKGVQIYENNVKIDVSDVSCITSGSITVIEKIGKLEKSNRYVNDKIESEE